MKRTILLCIAFGIGMTLAAQVFSPESLEKAAAAFIRARHSESRLQSCEPLMNDNRQAVGYLFRLAPSGFIIVSASDKIKPVYAYAYENDFAISREEKESLTKTITRDLQSRISASGYFSESLQTVIRQDWATFLAGNLKSKLFEQWPPEGTTNSGGWLETNWTQKAPYNEMCPMDLNTGTRSYAGCPAIAMAQILNYHREIHQTRFDSTDDYHHVLGPGYNFWIDDDYQTRDFPCFDTLNLWLDTLESTYLANGELTAPLKAAICFACGVAAKQCFSSIVSGTYGMEQAIMAYQRFGFTESVLVYPTDTTLNSQIAENVKVMLPVHLGLLSETSGGHNVVVDGYNTDEFYHFNFGWGGLSNGWYTLPPTGIPYSLTIIESAALNIKSGLYTHIPEIRGTESEIFLSPNPVKESFAVSGLEGAATLKIYTLQGKLILTTKLTGPACRVNASGLATGCYLYSITPVTGSSFSGTLIKN